MGSSLGFQRDSESVGDVNASAEAGFRFAVQVAREEGLGQGAIMLRGHPEPYHVAPSVDVLRADQPRPTPPPCWSASRSRDRDHP